MTIQEREPGFKPARFKALFPFNQLQRPGAGHVLAALLLAAGAAGCAPIEGWRPVPSALAPAGPAAARISMLWWLMFGLGTVIYLGVMAYLAVALFRRRREQPEDFASHEQGRNVVLLGGIVMPAVVLVTLIAATIGTLRAISAPAETDPDALTIEVIGRQWWWEVYYPQQQFYTANEIHIPAGERVKIIMTSEDVIHSFWVPQLHGKLDLNPKQFTTLWLEADQPGVYWGECAEFCGVQHAKMQFAVIAHPRQELEAWFAAQQQPAPEPVTESAQRGLEVFTLAQCGNCHRIQGTHATGILGPDLTHMASRMTLGAGTVLNNRGNLGGWVKDPHGIKPGVLMPSSPIDGADMEALLDYLASLE